MQDHDNPRSFNQDLGRYQRVNKKEREGAASCRKSEFINSLHMVYIILVFLRRVSSTAKGQLAFQFAHSFAI